MKKSWTKRAKLFRAWKKYLLNSRLSKDEIMRRASMYSRRGEKVPED